MSRRMLVTGATDGIGKQTALELARRGHRVVVHGRSEAKVSAVVAELQGDAAVQQAAVGGVEGVVADFSSLAAVRRMAGEVRERFPDLSVLVNNAGVYTESRRESADGLELGFAVNHLAPLLLTDELVSLLSANGSAEEPSRVVFVSSLAQLSYPGTAPTPPAEADMRMRWDDLQSTRDFHPFRTYALTKLCNVIAATELAAENPLADSRIVFTSMTPGPVATQLLQSAAPEFVPKAFTIEQGAESVVRLVVDPVGLQTGAFVNRDGTLGEKSPLARDPATTQRLMRDSRDLVRSKTV